MASAVSDDDDAPQLSAATFAALQEFYQEQEERESMITRLEKMETDKEFVFEEDWQLSQFWYDEKTIDTLVDVTIKTVGPNAKIALISCPTLYPKIKESAGRNATVNLFEYDNRFAVYGEDFIFYDYKSPLSIPRDKADFYDMVIADPPFLSDECLTKTAVTIRFLTKGKIILCTGIVMSDLANRLLDLRKSKFEPHHRNNLANEFSCFSNFDLDSLFS